MLTRAPLNNYISRLIYIASFLCISAPLILSNANADTPEASTSKSTPKVLVSIKPLHSLISHITDGINQTDLLLDQQQSAHHFQLRPSQKRKVNQADIFFYSSESIEGFVSSLKNTASQLTFVELVKTPGIKSLPNRGLHDHGHDMQHAESHIDGHIWLSIDNARHIAEYVTRLLTERDPANKINYKQNLNHLLVKLDNLQKSNNQLLSKIKNQPFLIYHDAFQYFENENQFTGAYFITTSPEHTPGIKHIKELKQLINNRHIECLYYEPPTIPPLVKTLAENTSIKTFPLDPAGTHIPAGKQHYFKLMNTTAQALYNCLHTP